MNNIVTQTLLTPAHVLDYKPAQWDSLIRQARRANLLSRLAYELQSRDLIARLPTYAQPHLLAALRLSDRQRIATKAEITRVANALAEANIRLILLKGAAYLARDLPCADGRLFGDIDLLVPHTALPETESTLLRHGWITTHHNTYDQTYYRRWMHEIPPLRHVVRHSVLDVHHNILPATAKAPPDAGLLLAGAMAVTHMPNVYTLSPPDMVLHSACHLFHEGELENGLRDLFDLHQLLLSFNDLEGFWSSLLQRAQQLHLQRPLFYALHFTQLKFNTTIPGETQEQMTHFAPWRGHTKFMDALYMRALQPAHPLADDTFTGLARWLLYVRSHWLRMPPYLLAYHLSRKALMRYLGFEDKDERDAQQLHIKKGE